MNVKGTIIFTRFKNKSSFLKKIKKLNKIIFIFCGDTQNKIMKNKDY